MMIRKVVFLFLLTFSFASDELKWFAHFDEALAAAKKEDKVLLLYFSGSDWCRPCMLLKKKVFDTKEFRHFAGENLVIAMFDFPAQDRNKLNAEQIKHNEKMAERYNPKGNFPLVVLVSAQGEKITKFAGYKNETETRYVAKLQEAIKAE
jgi:thioredoxin-related protein